MATLGFSTQWPKRMGGKPTEFVPKIWVGIVKELPFSLCDWDTFEASAYKKIGDKGLDAFESESMQPLNPKLHTIRVDEKNLWVPGRKIHMVVFNRTKNRFQFAPVLEVKSVQKITINTEGGIWDEKENKTYPLVWINNNHLMEVKELKQLAVNDGFDSVEHFFQWFNSDFEGKIIHWTNLKY
jgi:hypothetical protein